MEQEGIFYFFKHEQGKHTLTLADAKTAYADCPENEVAYAAGSFVANHISAWDHSYEYRPGKWTQTDYNFETPSTSLLTTTSTVVSLPSISKYEMFDYPGLYGKTSDGNPITKVRMEEEEAPYDTVRGASSCCTFTPAGKFKLTRHECDAEKKTYALISVEHRASEGSYEMGGGGSEYSNSFTCMPADVVFRPARITPKPFVQGPQTAVVVGKSGEEIFTDKYGRVKVQFFWDRDGKKDENSSCWIRVAELWAGKQWGIVFNPRIGQEVVVDFLEGDPDRPLITGRVYNADLMPPYTLPDNQTQSTIKTRSSKGGGTDNFNELRFEDKMGKEEIYFHAELDFNRVVENNDTLKVGSDKAKDGSQTIEIYKNRTETVKTGNETITISKGHRSIKVETGKNTLQVKDDTTVIVDQGKYLLNVKTGDHAVKIDTGNDLHQVKTGNREVKVDTGNDTLTIKTGNHEVDVLAGKSLTTAAKSITLSVTPATVKLEPSAITLSIGGSTIKLEPSAITLSMGPSSIKIDPSGVAIAGMMTKMSGTVQAKIDGLMTMISGSAMAKLGGGVTMIG
jgi:type VI secretion system secreted protein VgrG